MAASKLHQQLASIGVNVNFSGDLLAFTDIEETIVSVLNNIPNHKRLLGLILSWTKLHGDKVNIERLAKLVDKKMPDWIGLLAVFSLHCKHHRWKKLIQRPDSLLSNGSLASAKSRAKLKGEEAWSKGTGYLIPKGSESIADKFILAPEQIAKINRHYKNKLLYGPNWRADIATAIEKGAQNPHQAAKICGCSYEPAHRVFKDFCAAGLIERNTA